RVAVDQRLIPLDLRHVGLATPQGADPMLPAAYKAFITSHGGRFYSDREFDIEPGNAELLDLLAIRYFIAADPEVLKTLTANRRFSELEPADSYYHVFEWSDAQPVYRWEGNAAVLIWTPEWRSVRVTSAAVGRFTLLENFLPGWTASIDGMPAPIARW